MKHPLLTELKKDYFARRYPNVPKHAFVVPTYTENANGLRKMISNFFLWGMGVEIDAINTMGTPIGFDPKTRKPIFRKTGATVGMSDVHVTVAGRSVYIEIKWGKDRLREKQFYLLKHRRAQGAVVMVVRTFEDFLQQLLETDLLEEGLKRHIVEFIKSNN